MAEVKITSFGYLHGAAPEADIAVDLRRHFRDPHVSPELRYLTAEDEAVREAVRETGGIMEVVRAVAHMVEAYLQGPSGDQTVHVAIGCAGGRHRAASVAMELRERLDVGHGLGVALVHRDLHRDVVER